MGAVRKTMQMLTADEYAFLAKLATAYRDTHLASIKQTEGWNPRLGVDALCFQRCFQNGFQHGFQNGLQPGGTEYMVGALITPCELWLAAVPNQSRPSQSAPDQSSLAEPLADSLSLTLPSGAYRLILERLPGGYAFYKRAILHDLSELDSMQEAARLAQQMMARLMQPAETESV